MYSVGSCTNSWAWDVSLTSFACRLAQNCLMWMILIRTNKVEIRDDNPYGERRVRRRRWEEEEEKRKRKRKKLEVFIPWEQVTSFLIGKRQSHRTFFFLFLPTQLWYYTVFKDTTVEQITPIQNIYGLYLPTPDNRHTSLKTHLISPSTHISRKKRQCRTSGSVCNSTSSHDSICCDGQYKEIMYKERNDRVCERRETRKWYHDTMLGSSKEGSNVVV